MHLHGMVLETQTTLPLPLPFVRNAYEVLSNLQYTIS